MFVSKLEDMVEYSSGMLTNENSYRLHVDRSASLTSKDLDVLIQKLSIDRDVLKEKEG